MKVVLETNKLKQLVARAMKGISNNEAVMRTCWLGIKCQDNVLSITSWDGQNYLQVSEDKVQCDDFKVTVTADKFSQLVAKTTTEKISMELTDKFLKVKANGDYKLELPVNDEGELDNYPELVFDMDKSKASEIKLSAIVCVQQCNKISLAKTPEIPYLMCYYFGDNVLTTNGTTAAMSKIKVFEEPTLLKAELVDLIATMENEKIEVRKDGNKILLTTPKTTILGYYNEGIEQFEEQMLQVMQDTFQTPCPSSCTVKKDVLTGILDRIKLFVQTKEEGVRVLFTKEGIQFYNKEGSINELLPYATSENFASFEEKLQLDVFKELVNVNSDEDLYINYGNEGYLKLGKDKCQHLLTVLVEDTNA